MTNRTIKDAVDTRLADIKASDELKSKITNYSGEEKFTRKRPFVIGVAAVLCCALSVSVMAAAISNYDKLLSAVSPQIAQNLQPIKLASEDKGIRMEVLAALTDNDTAVVYISMQDLTADRVDDSIDLYHFSVTGMNLFTSKVISYDKASRTAIIRLLANGGKKLEGKKATLSIESFLSDKKVFGLFDTGIDLAKAVSAYDKKTATLDMHNVSGGGGNLIEQFRDKGTINILKPDETNIALPKIDFAHISNIGMIDERLHIQTKWTGGGIDDHGTLALIDNSGNRINPSNIYFGTDEYGNTGYGSEYVEYIFEVKETELNKYKLNADYFMTAGNYTEGQWQNTFRIEAVEKGMEVNCEIDLDGIKINKVSVSAVGVSITGTGNEIGSTDDINVSLKMIDGGVLAMEPAVSQNEDGNFTCKYMPSEPIKVANVKEVSINGKAVELK